MAEQEDGRGGEGHELRPCGFLQFPNICRNRRALSDQPPLEYVGGEQKQGGRRQGALEAIVFVYASRHGRGSIRDLLRGKVG